MDNRGLKVNLEKTTMVVIGGECYQSLLRPNPLISHRLVGVPRAVPLRVAGIPHRMQLQGVRVEHLDHLQQSKEATANLSDRETTVNCPQR